MKKSLAISNAYQFTKTPASVSYMCKLTKVITAVSAKHMAAI